MSVETRINRLGKHLIEYLAQGLQSGTISLPDAKKLASLYLQHICTAQNDQEINQRIKEIHTRYPALDVIVRSDHIWTVRAQDKTSL